MIVMVTVNPEEVLHASYSCNQRSSFPVILLRSGFRKPADRRCLCPTPARPLSTGVKPAHVLYSPNVELPSATVETLPYDAEVILKLNVDENGQAQDVQVVKSPSPLLDEPVAELVRQSRFRPATLDNQPVATPMTLTVVVQH
jgi:TonB family protein